MLLNTFHPKVNFIRPKERLRRWGWPQPFFPTTRKQFYSKDAFWWNKKNACGDRADLIFVQTDIYFENNMISNKSNILRRLGTGLQQEQNLKAYFIESNKTALVAIGLASTKTFFNTKQWLFTSNTHFIDKRKTCVDRASFC